MAICGLYLSQKGLLENNTVVSTVMSNIGLELALRECGLKMVRTKVGIDMCLRRCFCNNYNFGGEQSGHIIFLNHNTTGDGILTGVNLIKAMVDQNKTLSELSGIMKVFPKF